MKFLLFFIITCTCKSIHAQNFDEYFFNKSLRIDFTLYGTKSTSNVSITQLKEEPHWAGAREKRIFPKYGSFCVQITDKYTGELLYSKGFSSLFNEWKHNSKAKSNVRFFKHAMQVPFPKKEVTISIQERNKKGFFETLLTKDVKPNDYFIRKEKSKEYPITTLLKNGKPAHKVDLVILAEGYTKHEKNQFVKDAQRLVNTLFAYQPFNELKSYFNIYAIASESIESGTDMPGKYVYKNTCFNSSFYTFDMERYLTINDMNLVADVASLVPYDQIYVLVNTSKYGGGAFYNHLNLATAQNSQSQDVFVHEFGHGLVGLADEYANESTAFNEMYASNVEPWEPNITTLVDVGRKWKRSISSKVPIPTPNMLKYKDSIGVFEGAGYVPKGVYRPAQNCLMRSFATKKFCPVCQEQIKKTILQLVDTK